MSRSPTAWDRALWGVQLDRLRHDDDAILIGALWATDLGGAPYAGEPTRPLLFCTRAQARAWCTQMMAQWAHGDSIVRSWRLRAVRVRETVARC